MIASLASSYSADACRRNCTAELASRHADAVAENEALAAENQKNLSEANRYKSLNEALASDLDALNKQYAADKAALDDLKRRYAQAQQSYSDMLKNKENLTGTASSKAIATRISGAAQKSTERRQHRCSRSRTFPERSRPEVPRATRGSARRHDIRHTGQTVFAEKRTNEPLWSVLKARDLR